MRPKSIALLLLALGCGLVASIGITQVVANRTEDKPQIAGETANVLVALQNLEMGDSLTPQVVRLEPWPKDRVPAGALSTIDDVEGRRTKMRLFVGEPIVENKLYGKNEVVGGSTPLIPKGYRVVSLKVDDVSGGANLLMPGERVDVLVFVERRPDKGIGETSTRTVLQDVKVFAVNNDVSGDNDNDKDTHSIKAKTISLLVTPEQAAKVMLASELGRIRLIMRRPDDDTLVSDTNVGPNDVLGENVAGGNRAQETAAAGGAFPAEPKEPSLLNKSFLALLNAASRPTAAAPAVKPNATGMHLPALPAGPTWTIRILQPGAVSDVVLEQGPALGDSSATKQDKNGRWQILGAPSAQPSQTPGNLPTDLMLPPAPTTDSAEPAAPTAPPTDTPAMVSARED